MSPAQVQPLNTLKSNDQEKKQYIDSSKNDTERNRKDKKKKKNYSSRSGSRSHSYSNENRSRSKTPKKINKKHKHRSRSRSNDYRRKYDRDSDRYDRNRQSRGYSRNSRDRKHKDRRDSRDQRDYRDHKDYRGNNGGNGYRGRDRYNDKEKNKPKKQQIPLQVPMPTQIPMPDQGIMNGQRRRRQRSRSPLNYYRRNQNNNEGQFWDSFSWQPRINYTPNVSSSALVNTKKMRRLMITNVPYEIGMTQNDLRDLITRYMTENYLKDTMNNCPVVNLQINQADRNVAVELSSVQQTCRICKLEKIQLFKGIINGIIRLGDSCYGNNIVTQAQNAAQAQAAAFAAINVLQNKKTNFNMDVNLNKGPETSTLIRVTNAVTPYMASHLTKQQWQEYHEDLIQGFSQFGTLIHNWFVKKDQKDICADSGNLFIEYQSRQQAMKAMEEMQNRIYDQRSIKLYYVPRQLYYKNYKKDLTPPALKEVKSKPVGANQANGTSINSSTVIPPVLPTLSNAKSSQFESKMQQQPKTQQKKQVINSMSDIPPPMPIQSQHQ